MQTPPCRDQSSSASWHLSNLRHHPPVRASSRQSLAAAPPSSSTDALASPFAAEYTAQRLPSPSAIRPDPAPIVEPATSRPCRLPGPRPFAQVARKTNANRPSPLGTRRRCTRAGSLPAKPRNLEHIVREKTSGLKPAIRLSRIAC